jgi:hypothetical protein
VGPNPPLPGRVVTPTTAVQTATSTGPLSDSLPACVASPGRCASSVTVRASCTASSVPSRVRSVQPVGDEVEALERSLFGREVPSGSHGASVVALSDSIALVEQMILRILTS